ncbi:homoserine O-acetyltransferase MetX [Leucobacter aridicollis]|uniref:Homoserine O-acetyltransferase n=1 Tax=Leucobacter aridicollis TaxID=283878 RepID=A0A852RD60_9MICO|nr:homoserine O-acetyltransferase [Leucobacter aridicollis]MBL3682826.1 homoserine O-acetyltransferase [Leucobacter aridicollis]NYD26264.1 homoserine O-acetyltransferase [Leucobacter aridicollis]
MDWQTPEDSFPTDFITDAQLRALMGRPPISGGWRDGDPVGNRQFVSIGSLTTEAGEELPHVRIAYETFGELNEARDNAILVFHALTGDSHLVGAATAGHPTDGWWSEIVGPGRPLDTNRYCIIAPNVLGGCQGTTGPGSLAADHREWGARFPYLTVRDQVQAATKFADALGVERFAAVIGGSMGGMHALEWGIVNQDRTARLAVIAAPPVTTADQIGLNLVQLEAIRSDPSYHGGDYYDAPDGIGPHHGLATARRLALLNYRSNTELDDRFGRSWQSAVSPLGGGGRFAVESYLDFHGNKFTRRFDANSYVTLVQAMNSHDVGRGRGGVRAALQTLELPTLVLGIPSDRLFTIEGQDEIARHTPGSLDGTQATRIDSPYGHDSFLIEFELVGAQLTRLLAL